MPKKLAFNVEAYVADLLVNQYPEQEMTMRHILDWYKYTHEGDDPPFQMFHVRDALYRLEAQNVVMRSNPETSKNIYWCCTQDAFDANTEA
jgi:hypothetical protein